MKPFFVVGKRFLPTASTLLKSVMHRPQSGKVRRRETPEPMSRCAAASPVKMTWAEIDLAESGNFSTYSERFQKRQS
jgi:hypothetical protein